MVWYNKISGTDERKLVVVPRWFLVWYNVGVAQRAVFIVVVPRWLLVWYNLPANMITTTDGCSSPVVLGMV